MSKEKQQREETVRQQRPETKARDNYEAPSREPAQQLAREISSDEESLIKNANEVFDDLGLYATGGYNGNLNKHLGTTVGSDLIDTVGARLLEIQQSFMEDIENIQFAGRENRINIDRNSQDRNQEIYQEINRNKNGGLLPLASTYEQAFANLEIRGENLQGYLNDLTQHTQLSKIVKFGNIIKFGFKKIISVFRSKEKRAEAKLNYQAAKEGKDMNKFISTKKFTNKIKKYSEKGKNKSLPVPQRVAGSKVESGVEL